MFWVGIVVSLAFAVIGELIRPKQAVPNARASALDDFDMPTAESGRNISIWCGKVRISGSNVTWYGDLYVRPLTKKVKTGMFSKATQTYAFQYNMGIQHVLGFGRPDVKLHRVFFDEAEANHTVTQEADGSELWYFDDQNLFGGTEAEGGVSGTMRFYPGNQTQLPNVYLAAKVGEAVPAYRGVCHAIFEFFYLGTSKYIKPVSFEVSSYPNTLAVAGGKHIIGEDANPACFIYEILTSQVWGVGKSSAAVDLENFRAVAETLHAEGLGVSIIRNTATAADEIIADVLRHIDGVLFSDPTTGLACLKLARDDYNIDDLPVYGARDFIDPPKFSRPSWSETRNTLIVSYTDRANNYTTTPATFHDQANLVQRRGEVASESVDFSGFTTEAAMLVAANRAMKTYSYPLASLSGRLTRRAWRTRPGDVVVIDWPELGINRIPFRITRVGYGSIKQNSITFDSIEDIFAVGEQAFSPPPSSGWENPARPPAALARQAMMEAPYFLSASDDANTLAFAAASSGLDLGVNVQSGPTVGSMVPLGGSSDFTAGALLVSPLLRDQSAAVLGSVLGSEELILSPTVADVAAGETVALIRSATSEEWVSYTGIDLGTGAMTGLRRGLFDTVPQGEHPVGAQVWFPPTGFIPTNNLPISPIPSTLYARLVPYSALGSLAESSAVVMSTTVNQRAARPYPPGRIRIGGVRPDLIAATTVSPFVLTWAHRDRTAEGSTGQDDPSVGPEEGITYTIRLKNGTSVLIEKANIDPSASQATIESTFDGNLTVEILAVRDGLESYQVQSYTIAHSKGATTATSITPDEATYVLDGGGA